MLPLIRLIRHLGPQATLGLVYFTGLLKCSWPSLFEINCKTKSAGLPFSSASLVPTVLTL